MGEIELLDLYWTVGGPVGRARRARVEHCSTGATAAPQAARVGFRGLGLWHADVEHQLETSTLREMKRIFDDAGLSTWRSSSSPTSSPSPASRRARSPTRCAQAAVRDRGRVRRPPHQGRQHPRHPVRARPADRGVRGALRGRGQPHRRDGRLRVHAVRRQRQHARRGARARQRRRRAQRRPGDRHLAHVQARDRPRGAAPDPAPSTSPGSSSPTASSRTWTTRSTRPSTTARLPGRGRVRRFPATSRPASEVGYGGPWGVEVLSAELRSLPIEQEFERAYETTAAQFRAGRRVREERVMTAMQTPSSTTSA